MRQRCPTGAPTSSVDSDRIGDTGHSSTIRRRPVGPVCIPRSQRLSRSTTSAMPDSKRARLAALTTEPADDARSGDPGDSVSVGASTRLPALTLVSRMRAAPMRSGKSSTGQTQMPIFCGGWKTGGERERERDGVERERGRCLNRRHTLLFQWTLMVVRERKSRTIAIASLRLFSRKRRKERTMTS